MGVSWGGEVAGVRGGRVVCVNERGVWGRAEGGPLHAGCACGGLPGTVSALRVSTVAGAAGQ